MLSEDLRSLLAKFEKANDGEISLSANAVGSIRSLLLAAITDAVHLEAHAPRQHCLREIRKDQGEGVVDFADAKAQRRIRDWLEQQGVTVLPPEGGPGGVA